MTLTREQRKQLRDALLDAFPTKPKLSQFVNLELDKNLDALAIGDDLNEIIFKLIKDAEAQGEEADLIFAAREANPSNPKLAVFVRAYEAEYWRQLAQQAGFYQPEEAEASQVIEVVVQEVERVENQSTVDYPDELKPLLLEILDKLNQPGTAAAAKAKLALPLIPGIFAYEMELDTENTLRQIFQPIKRLYQGIRQKK